MAQSKRSIRFGSAQVRHTLHICPPSPARDRVLRTWVGVNAHSLNGRRPSTNGRSAAHNLSRVVTGGATPYRSTLEPLPTKQTSGLPCPPDRRTVNSPESRNRDYDRPRTPLLPRTLATLAWRTSNAFL